MSRNLDDFIDPDFWDWYRDRGPSWLIDERLDILTEMYEAFDEDDYDPNSNLNGLVTMKPGAPFFFAGTSEELDEFANALKQALISIKNAREGSNKTITNEEIIKLRSKLDYFKLRRKNNENNKGKN